MLTNKQLIELKKTASETAKNVQQSLDRYKTGSKGNEVIGWDEFVYITEDSKGDILGLYRLVDEDKDLIDELTSDTADQIMKSAFIKVKESLLDYVNWLTAFQNDYDDNLKKEDAKKLLTTYNTTARTLLNVLTKQFLPALNSHIAKNLQINAERYNKAKEFQKELDKISNYINLYKDGLKILRSNRELLTEYEQQFKLTGNENYSIIEPEHKQSRDLILEIDEFFNSNKEFITSIDGRLTTLTVLDMSIEDVMKNKEDVAFYEILVADLLKELPPIVQSIESLNKKIDRIKDKLISEDPTIVIVNKLKTQIELDPLYVKPKAPIEDMVKEAMSNGHNYIKLYKYSHIGHDLYNLSRGANYAHKLNKYEKSDKGIKVYLNENSYHFLQADDIKKAMKLSGIKVPSEVKGIEQIEIGIDFEACLDSSKADELDEQTGVAIFNSMPTDNINIISVETGPDGIIFDRFFKNDRKEQSDRESIASNQEFLTVLALYVLSISSYEIYADAQQLYF